MSAEVQAVEDAYLKQCNKYRCPVDMKLLPPEKAAILLLRVGADLKRK